MKSRDWFQTSPHGTARERFRRIVRSFAPDRTADGGPLAGSAMNPSDSDTPTPGPSGANRRPGHMPDELAEFFRNVAAGARAHDLGDESLYLAEELAELQWSLGGRQKQALALLVLATMISARHGSTRLPLSRSVDSYLGRLLTSLLSAGRLDLDPKRVLADIDELTRAVTLDQLIGRPGEYRPLIVADDCVYQHRMLWCESRLASALRARVDNAAGLSYLNAQEPAIDEALSDVLARAPIRDGAPVALSREQQDAVRQALARRFTVISGGPGTGKTAVVVTMLRVLRRLGEPLDTIALAAPTGKAANRMWSSIRSGLGAVVDPTAEDRELAEGGVEPRTLHRLLGYMPGSDRFRHHENSPLAVSTAIIDEASMIDLALMERLLRAMPTGARLVLLGDADQLPSVDAGAVLRDLVLAGEPARMAREQTDAEERRPADAPPAGHPRDFAVRLTHSYRMSEDNPAGRAILSAARAVNAGDIDALLEGEGDAPGYLLERSEPGQLEYRGIERLETESELSPVHEFIDDWYKRRIKSQSAFALGNRLYRYRYGAWAPGDESDLTQLFAVYERSRLLTVTRRQTTGSEAMNRRLHRRILSEAEVERAPAFYPGEPVIMRRNDYERGLFNGDQGLIVRASVDGGPQHFQVVFPRGDGFALFRLDALRAHIELAFAMTVHKSQGSEFDGVALILPQAELPLLSRELLYTGITRARDSVVLVGADSLLRYAVAKESQRFSGLAEKLASERTTGRATDSKAS